MYYILKSDGSSIFENPYPFDFCIHCLMLLIDNPDPSLRNCHLMQFSFDNVRSNFSPSAVEISSNLVSGLISTAALQ